MNDARESGPRDSGPRTERDDLLSEEDLVAPEEELLDGVLPQPEPTDHEAPAP